MIAVKLTVYGPGTDSGSTLECEVTVYCDIGTVDSIVLPKHYKREVAPGVKRDVPMTIADANKWHDAMSWGVGLFEGAHVRDVPDLFRLVDAQYSDEGPSYESDDRRLIAG